MKDAFIHLAEILDLGGLSKGYKLYFMSSVFKNDDNDTKENVLSQLESFFEEIKAFESDVSSKWLNS